MKKASAVSVSGLSVLTYRRKKSRRKRISGKNKFRALVRQVIENRSWLELINLESDFGDNVKANVKIIQSKATKGELRLGNEKVILRKNNTLRTEEEKNTLFKILGDLKCFRRYPEDVRRELVAHTYFVYYGPNRTLMRQGHESTFMAVLLTGELAVYISYIDPVFSKKVTERKPNMLSGTMVGEISLIHNTNRTATVVTVTPVELLVLYKDDFNYVLKDTLQSQWNEIKACLAMFPYFSKWSADAIRECYIMSDIKKYKENDIVFAPNNNKNILSHFILSGKCLVVQKIMIQKVGERWKLRKSIKDNGPGRGVCMEVCEFIEGACFGIGENLRRKYVIAETEMSILRIPFFILEKYNVANIWTRIRTFLDSRMPSPDELFEKFQQDSTLEKYRKSVRESYKVRQLQNSTTIHDVPLTLRAQLLHFDEHRDSLVRTSSLQKSILDKISLG